LLVGPASHADFLDLERPITVCVDGSPSSESILPIVASWAIVFHLDTRVVHVVPSRHRDDPLADESEYAKRIAASLEVEIGRRVSYDVLRGDAVADVVANDARVQHAGIVAAATHGATGLHRVVAGSVAMGIVHHAPCPVLAYRPLEYLR
jgi:nucleotide-binding universal stress UspA family protein